MKASVPPVPSTGIVYVTPDEIFGEEPSLDRVRRLLAEIPRAAMTDVTCKMGTLNDSDSFQDWVGLDRRELRAVFLEPSINSHQL